VKHGEQTVYLVRETKGTKDYLCAQPKPTRFAAANAISMRWECHLL
jgi:hypothetical protein